MTHESPCCGVVPSDIRWKRIDDSPWPTNGRMVMALDPAIDINASINVLMPPTC
jgi:hypothetical protein